MADLVGLRSSPLFAGMSDAEISSLARMCSEKVIPEGMTIFLENMPGESLYLVQRGAVKVSKMITEGEEKILVVLGPEEIFGEMALLDAAPRTATARVAEDATLLCMRRSDFETLSEQNPALALKLTRNIIRIFSRRIRENNEEFRKMLLWSLGK